MSRIVKAFRKEISIKKNRLKNENELIKVMKKVLNEGKEFHKKNKSLEIKLK
jgi:hypothetical protein